MIKKKQMNLKPKVLLKLPDDEGYGVSYCVDHHAIVFHFKEYRLSHLPIKYYTYSKTFVAVKI